jgi:hypothetical protein
MAPDKIVAEYLGGPPSGQTLAERARIAMYGLSSIANFEPNFLPMVFGQGGPEGRARSKRRYSARSMPNSRDATIST